MPVSNASRQYPFSPWDRAKAAELRWQYGIYWIYEKTNCPHPYLDSLCQITESHDHIPRLIDFLQDSDCLRKESRGIGTSILGHSGTEILLIPRRSASERDGASVHWSMWRQQMGYRTIIPSLTSHKCLFELERLFFMLCISVCGICMCMYKCVHVYRARGQCWVSSLITFQAVFWDMASHWSACLG